MVGALQLFAVVTARSTVVEDGAIVVGADVAVVGADVVDVVDVVAVVAGVVG